MKPTGSRRDSGLRRLLLLRINEGKGVVGLPLSDPSGPGAPDFRLKLRSSFVSFILVKRCRNRMSLSGYGVCVTGSVEHLGATKSALDSTGRIIRTQISGFLNINQVDEYYVGVERLVNELRRCNLPVLMLVDIRSIAVQHADVAAALNERALKFWRAGDRTAIMVEPSLARMQVRRVLDVLPYRTFTSDNEAIDWLTAP
jgi:hypothetical protein